MTIDMKQMRILAGLDTTRPSLKEAQEMAEGGAADKHSKNGWSRVAEVRSSSDPSKFYVIGVRSLKTGKQQIGCSCPGWIYAKGDKKPCKHIKQFLDGTGSMKDTKVTPFGSQWMQTNGVHGECICDTTLSAIVEGKSEKDLTWVDLDDAIENDAFADKDEEAK